VFSALAAEESNVSATVNKLPGALRQTESTLSKVDTFGDRLGPALNALRPAFRRLDETNAAVRPFVTEAAPIVRDQIRPFTRRAKPYTADLGRAARDTSRALPDLTGSLSELNRFFNIGAYNPGGAEGLSGDIERDRDREEGYLYWLAWTAQNGVSLFNTSDATGPFRRTTLCGVSLPSAATQLQGAIQQLVQNDPTQITAVPQIVDSVVSSGFGTCEF